MSIEETLSSCAAHHARKWKKYASKQRQQLYELPCGCGEQATLEELLTSFTCEECDETYIYSFCLKEVVSEDEIWHCNACGTCRESAEWHCNACNDCTYGLTLPCDGCGKKSPYIP